MKYIFLLTILSIFNLSEFENSDIEPVEVTLIVTDEKEHPLSGAGYIITKNGESIKAGFTDMNGQSFFNLEEGYYTIAVSHPRYLEIIKTGYRISTDNATLKFTLFPSTGLPEIEITGIDKSRERKAYDYESPGISRAVSPASVTLRGYSSGSKAREIDLPGSGQVTAGEWNDLSNWTAWKKLVAEEEYNKMQSYWSINTLERYGVVVVNTENIPIPGAQVQMVDKKGEILWSAYTDVSGKAELWHNAYNSQNEPSRIMVNYRDSREIVRQIRTIDQGSMVVTVDEPCIDDIKIDISFVVDATSSMSDEISYLQSELLNVIDRVKNDHHDIRWSSVFYRDKEDSYVTKSHPFSEDPGEVLEFIRQQEANGGGDFPEAVSQAMDEAINNLSWRKESNVKLCFLLLDAPPHGDVESMELFRRSVRQAASMGIKIIPITASGIDRETEFLMKFVSILTNGTYIFITDDSGIGDPHLDPVVEDYEVEKLNDLIVRLINSFSRAPLCHQDIIATARRELKLYPNPAANFLNVDNASEGEKIYIISTSGKIVGNHTISSGGTIRIDLDDLISGSYLLRWVAENQDPYDYPFLIIK